MFKRLMGVLSGGRVNEQEFARFLRPVPGEPLIRLDRISKTFGKGETKTEALRDVDLTIDHGDFVTVAGPSGCGKSTLLHTIGLLESPSSGNYFLNGTEAGGLKAAELAWIRNRGVGFIFQNFNLIGDLTVLENVETPLAYLRVPGGERRGRAMAALKRVEMDGYAKRYPSQLTGGEQQRAAVARAVVAEPQILMADEPTGNLDSRNGELVMGLLQELHSAGATLFLVTHNPEYARRSQRTVYLFDGRITDPKEIPEVLQ